MTAAVRRTPFHDYSERKPQVGLHETARHIAYIFSINVSSFVVAYTDTQIPKQWDPVLPTTNSNIVMSRLAG